MNRAREREDERINQDGRLQSFRGRRRSAELRGAVTGQQDFSGCFSFRARSDRSLFSKPHPCGAASHFWGASGTAEWGNRAFVHC